MSRCHKVAGSGASLTCAAKFRIFFACFASANSFCWPVPCNEDICFYKMNVFCATNLCDMNTSQLKCNTIVEWHVIFQQG